MFFVSYLGLWQLKNDNVGTGQTELKSQWCLSKEKLLKLSCNFQSFNVKQLMWMFYEEKVIVRWRSIFIIFSMYYFFQIKCSKNILKLTNFLTILSNAKLFFLLQRSFHFFYKEESWWKLFREYKMKANIALFFFMLKKFHQGLWIKQRIFCFSY